jgi:uncharacterized protein YgbK (DUF1537 family)
MNPALAIVADDLTGALDTATPFVLAGLKVAVAVRPEALEAALAAGAEIVSVNTASRPLVPSEATARIAAAAVLLRQAAPSIVMKKIDSRLKGNVGAESAALARGVRRSELVVAPAVPDQGRRTIGGTVTGRGVDTPIPIAPLFAGTGLPARIRDASTDADLDGIVAGNDWSAALAVGARGLGAAFARSLGNTDRHPTEQFRAGAATLFAFGSRDPITDAQIAGLAERHTQLVVVDSPGGVVDASDVLALPLVLRCAGPLTETPGKVAERFAGHVAALIAKLRPDTLVTGGGDTASALLEALGASVVFPGGEAAPGVPWFLIDGGIGHGLRCVVKSGGFGVPQVLADLLEPAAGA